jgi:hypothetical protein
LGDAVVELDPPGGEKINGGRFDGTETVTMDVIGPERVDRDQDVIVIVMTCQGGKGTPFKRQEDADDQESGDEEEEEIDPFSNRRLTRAGSPGISLFLSHD